MMRGSAAAAVTLAALVFAPQPAQAHLPTETSAEVRLREGTVEVSLSVSGRRWLGASPSGSGEQAGSGAVAAGLRIAGALREVDAVALTCGGAAVSLTLVSKLDGDALIAAAGGEERHLVIQLRGDRPADAALAQGCRLFLPTAFGPYFASMSAPQPAFAAAGGWSELKVTRLAAAPVAVAAPEAPTRTPVAVAALVFGVALLAARAGFVWGRRKRT